MRIPNVNPQDWHSLNYTLRLIDERLSEIEGVHGKANFRQPAYQQTDGVINPDTVRYDQLLGVTGFVPQTRILTAGNGLVGGGDLTVDRTFAVNPGNGIEILVDQVCVNNGDGLTFLAGELTTNLGQGLVFNGAAFDVYNGTGLDFSGLNELKLADTAVAPGAYTNASITVDQQGRLTAAASGSIVTDRLVSAVGSLSTFALTDDTLDQTLTGDLGGMFFVSAETDAADAIGFKFDTTNLLSTDGSNVFQVFNDSVEFMNVRRGDTGAGTVFSVNDENIVEIMNKDATYSLNIVHSASSGTASIWVEDIQLEFGTTSPGVTSAYTKMYMYADVFGSETDFYTLSPDLVDTKTWFYNRNSSINGGYSEIKLYNNSGSQETAQMVVNPVNATTNTVGEVRTYLTAGDIPVTELRAKNAAGSTNELILTAGATPSTTMKIDSVGITIASDGVVTSDNDIYYGPRSLLRYTLMMEGD